MPDISYIFCNNTEKTQKALEEYKQKNEISRIYIIDCNPGYKIQANQNNKILVYDHHIPYIFPITSTEQIICDLSTIIENNNKDEKIIVICGNYLDADMILSCLAIKDPDFAKRYNYLLQRTANFGDFEVFSIDWEPKEICERKLFFAIMDLFIGVKESESISSSLIHSYIRIIKNIIQNSDLLAGHCKSCIETIKEIIHEMLFRKHTYEKLSVYSVADISIKDQIILSIAASAITNTPLRLSCYQDRYLIARAYGYFQYDLRKLGKKLDPNFDTNPAQSAWKGRDDVLISFNIKAIKKEDLINKINEWAATVK